MTIFVNGVSFEDLNSVFEYLDREYENKDESEPLLSLTVRCTEVLEEDEFAQLLAFVIKKQKVAFQINVQKEDQGVLTPQVEQNKLLTDAYIVAKRTIFSQNTPIQKIK